MRRRSLLSRTKTDRPAAPGANDHLLREATRWNSLSTVYESAHQIYDLTNKERSCTRWSPRSGAAISPSNIGKGHARTKIHARRLRPALDLTLIDVSKIFKCVLFANSQQGIEFDFMRRGYRRPSSRAWRAASWRPRNRRSPYAHAGPHPLTRPSSPNSTTRSHDEACNE